MVAWQNGRLVDTPRVSAGAPGFLHGFSVFESLRTYGGAVWARPWHLERLRAGAHRIGLAGRWTDDEVIAALDEVLAAVRTGLPDAWRAVDQRLRITLYKGPDGRDGVELLVGASPLPPIEPARYERGWSARVAPWEHAGPGALIGIKHGAYLGFAMARAWAQAQGCDEALLACGGRLIEASAANVFVVHEGRVATPPPEAGPLGGIVRRWVLEAAPATCEPVEVDAMRSADEAFLTNAVWGVMPLVAVDGRPLGDGRPGPVTRRIARAFGEQVAAACGDEAAGSMWSGGVSVGLI